LVTDHANGNKPIMFAKSIKVNKKKIIEKYCLRRIGALSLKIELTKRKIPFTITPKKFADSHADCEKIKNTSAIVKTIIVKTTKLVIGSIYKPKLLITSNCARGSKPK